MHFKMNPTGHVRLSEVCAQRFGVRPGNVARIMKAAKGIPADVAARMAQGDRARKRRLRYIKT